MAQFREHLRRMTAIGIGTLAATTLPVVAVSADEVPPTPGVAFLTPTPNGTVAVLPDNPVHVVLGADPAVDWVQLRYRRVGTSAWSSIPAQSRVTGSDVIDVDWTATTTGTIELEAVGYDGTVGLPLVSTQVGAAATETLNLAGATRPVFSEPDPDGRDDRTGEKLCGPFIRPRVKIAKGTTGCAAVPLGIFTSRLDGHTYARATGQTTGTGDVRADAPTFANPTPASSRLAGTRKGSIFFEPVDLTGNPGLTTRRAVIRVTDGLSSEAVETPLYTQVVTHVRSTTRSVAGGVMITSKLSDQYGQPVVGAPVRLTGYANGSRTRVNQLVATDVNGVATFPGVLPANGFYIAVADVNLNGSKGPAEPSFETVVGRVAKSAPGKALYHNNARTRGAGGTVGDSLRGTRAAAARRYQWIDQNGQLAYTSRAVLKAGARRVSQPAHLTWVNAHGAPFNPRWLKKGRFETRAWSNIRRRAGLRNADMTFKQNAAYRLSVEWEVKNIRPFTSARALDAAFAGLAASARRYYGPNWRSRVHVKMLSNLPGGQAFALRVLQYAHAHGFTTIYLARGRATGTQIPASAHAYVDYVRGAAGSLYAYPPPAWQKDLPVPVDPALTAR